jgi:hypothetical protein
MYVIKFIVLSRVHYAVVYSGVEYYCYKFWFTHIIVLYCLLCIECTVALVHL